MCLEYTVQAIIPWVERYDIFKFFRRLILFIRSIPNSLNPIGSNLFY